MTSADVWRRHRWRTVAWAGAAALWSLPWAAMQFTDEVVWDAADFVFAGVLIFGTGTVLELTVRATGNRAYRAGVAVALAGVFALVWVNAAVGLIGQAGNDANLMFGAVIATGLLGSMLARFKAHRMTSALVATALAQVAVAAVAWVTGWGAPRDVLLLTCFFVTLWLGSALLFRRAARGRDLHDIG